jgi:hypothetical protein
MKVRERMIVSDDYIRHSLRAPPLLTLLKYFVRQSKLHPQLMSKLISRFNIRVLSVTWLYKMRYLPSPSASTKPAT